MPDQETQRSLGRIEANVSYLVERAKKQEEDADRLEERVRKVEKKINYAAGAVTIIAAGITAVWKWVNQ
jgi:DNA-binding protein YbaB